MNQQDVNGSLHDLLQRSFSEANARLDSVEEEKLEGLRDLNVDMEAA